jgi:hypothetical protein
MGQRRRWKPTSDERGVAVTISGTSSMNRVVLDPTNERRATTVERVGRPESLRGLTVGLLDISKARGDVFIDRLEERLSEMGADVKRYKKPTFTKPDLRHEISINCQVVIEALAD